MHKVLDNGLKAILCIGESKEEYEAGLNKEVKICVFLSCIGSLRRPVYMFWLSYCGHTAGGRTTAEAPFVPSHVLSS